MHHPSRVAPVHNPQIKGNGRLHQRFLKSKKLRIPPIINEVLLARSRRIDEDQDRQKDLNVAMKRIKQEDEKTEPHLAQFRATQWVLDLLEKGEKL